MGTTRSQSDSPRLADVLAARQRFGGLVARTGLKRSLALSHHCQADVFIKLETAQATGAFKVRGAANFIRQLSEEQRQAGVTTASSGNHGRAVAWISAELGLPATVCLSRLVPQSKVRAIEALGAEVCVVGDSQDEAVVHALKLADEHGMTYVPPFDHPHIVAGQGTIGLELLEDLPDIDTLVIQVSGGGLAAGTALALKSLRPEVEVIGVTMERGAAMYHSQQAGKPVHIEELSTLADSLQGGIGLDNRYTFPLCRQFVDRFELVSEKDIRVAMQHAFEREHLVLEGGGAAGIAWMLNQADALRGRRIALVATGDNIETNDFLTTIYGKEEEDAPSDD